MEWSKIWIWMLVWNVKIDRCVRAYTVCFTWENAYQPSGLAIISVVENNWRYNWLAKLKLVKLVSGFIWVKAFRWNPNEWIWNAIVLFEVRCYGTFWLVSSQIDYSLLMLSKAILRKILFKALRTFEEMMCFNLEITLTPRETDDWAVSSNSKQHTAHRCLFHKTRWNMSQQTGYQKV